MKILYADGLNNYIYVYNTMHVFFKTNPPCKECLVQSMCLKANDNISSPWIRTRICNKLIKFIDIKFIKMTLK